MNNTCPSCRGVLYETERSEQELEDARDEVNEHVRAIMDILDPLTDREYDEVVASLNDHARRAVRIIYFTLDIEVERVNASDIELTELEAESPFEDILNHLLS